jgi:hypothetical protein
MPNLPADLRAIQRKLDRWELIHLREHAADLAQQMDEMRELVAALQQSLDDADDRAAFWHDRVIDEMNDAQDTGATIGLSIDGALHVLPPPPTQ